MKKTYRAEFLFQGLFLLWPNSKGIAVLMPEAAGRFGPEACYSDPGRPLRQHAFVFQLPDGINWNSSAFKHNLIRHQVGQEKERRLLHWKSTKMNFGVLNSTVYRPADCNSMGGLNTHFQTCPVGICDDTSSKSVYHLVHHKGKLAKYPNTIARMTFTEGCAWSERPSEDPQGDPLEWIEIWADLVRVANEKDILGDIIAALQHLKRPLNLDLRVAIDIPENDDLILDVAGPKPLTVQSPGAGKCLEFVLRNQEWPAIFATSPHLTDPKADVGIDYDHEYLHKLAERKMDLITIPVPAKGNPFAPAGQGCGGSSGGY